MIEYNPKDKTYNYMGFITKEVEVINILYKYSYYFASDNKNIALHSVWMAKNVDTRYGNISARLTAAANLDNDLVKWVSEKIMEYRKNRYEYIGDEKWINVETRVVYDIVDIKPILSMGGFQVNRQLEILDLIHSWGGKMTDNFRACIEGVSFNTEDISEDQIWLRLMTDHSHESLLEIIKKRQSV